MSRRPAPRPAANWFSQGEGDAVLLINGWSASGIAWPSAWLDDLVAKYQVIRLDNRGTGWSRTARTPFTIGDLADDARDVLRAAGVRRARVLGLSMGGMIAQELALRHPDVVSRLVLAGTRPPAPVAHLSDTSLLADAMRKPAPGQSLTDYFLRMWSGFAAPGFAESHPEVMDELVRQVVRRPTPRNGVFAQVRAMGCWRGADRLRHLDVPTTVVHGTDDPLIDPVNGRIIADLVPGAALVELDGVGHLLPHEAPDVLTEALA